MKTGLLQAFSTVLNGDDLARLQFIVDGVENQLCALTKSTVATVDQVGTVTLKAGGKRLRPALVALSALASSSSPDVDRVICLGSVLELIHMATLIHDDVIDESKTRRGFPTAASLHGNTSAILSGDVLLARAMRALSLDGDLEIIRTVSESVVNLAEGEVLELECRGRLELSDHEYEEVLIKKTAALISCSCRVGAMAVGAADVTREALSLYGHHLGLAFQISDDVLDFRGDKAKTGKPWATDFREGQATLPLIMAMKSFAPAQREFVAKKFGNGVTDAEINDICSWMTDSNVFEDSFIEARRHSCLAQDQLEKLPATPFRSLLAQIAEFVVDRES